MISYLLIAIFFSSFTLIFTDLALNTNRIHRGIKISNISVSFLTKDEAALKIKSKASKFINKPLILSLGRQKWTIKPKELDTKLNIEKTVEEAFSYGRKGSILNQLKNRFGLWRKSKNIYVVYSVNEKKINKLLKKISKKNKKALNASIRIKNTDIKIITGQNGFAVNKNTTIDLIKERLSLLNNHPILIPVEILKPRILEDGAKKAYEDTKKMMSKPVYLKYNKNTWEITPAKIGSLIEFKEIYLEGSFVLRTDISKTKTVDYLTSITKDIFIPPKNAEFNVVGNSVTIVPGQPGFGIDQEATFEKIKGVLFDSPPREVILATKNIEPERTTEKALSMGIKEQVSTFTTKFNPAQTARVHNIRLLSSALDGAIVEAGETFSFNKTIGPRTAAKGYKEAPVILNGELVPGLGGGICQVGTTFFNTIFFGGYEVVERRNHSFYISHYPAGRDATVSYGGPDLKFKNDTNAAVLIKTSTTSNSLTISFYSTNQNTEVTYSTAPFTNFTPFETKYEDEPTLAKGAQKVKDKGEQGRHTTVVRTVKRKGATVRQDKFVSHYTPKKQIVSVGIKDTPSLQAEIPPPATNTQDQPPANTPPPVDTAAQPTPPAPPN
ncbi:MAG: VanW family protein [Actinobacteria bacterium]|nr:VanW family protein [Actinomycetota bacterium]